MLRLRRILRLIGCNVKRQYFSSITEPNGQPNELNATAKPLENLQSIIERRDSEVKRSIVVQIDGVNLSSYVYHYCRQFGEIKNTIAYSLKDKRNFVLIEYESEESRSEAFKHSGFQHDTLPWMNQYMIFKASTLQKPCTKDAPIQFSHVQAPPIVDLLSGAECIDEQISLLYQYTCMNDLLARLKFIGAMHVQQIVNFFMPTIFPNARIYPFGSTLNGYGRMGSDLDMALRFDEREPVSKINCDSPIRFHNRTCDMKDEEESKKLLGRQVRCMAALIDQYLLASKTVRFLPSTRVPLVTYYDTNIPCSVDLSVHNLTGFSDVQLMYALGVIDPRVRPFIFLIRRWAREFKITKHGPGDRFTNFQISYVALSFLQNLKEPVLPTFSDMIRMMRTARGNDNNSHDPMKQFYFIDLDQISFQSKNTSSIFDLFCQFMDYYRKFDFGKYMITLNTKGKIGKTSTTPLQMENLFNSESAIADNISVQELNTLKIMMEETLGELDQISLKPDGSDEWGILGLILHLKDPK